MAQCSSRCEIGQLAAAQTTAQQGREHRAVPFAVERAGVRRLAKTAGLLRREPVSKPNAQFLDALHTPNAGSQFGAEQPRI